MANETEVTVWGIGLEQEEIQTFSDALVSLGFPHLCSIVDENQTGGTRTGNFKAYGACFRCFNEMGNLFPVEHVISLFSGLAIDSNFEGGIIVDDDHTGETHNLLFSPKGAKVHSKSLEYGVIHVRS